ncbi:EAL domain-containing protein [Marinobacter salexigens]|uniref:EAL domain-containing protein n=1 Tax=Marinobacter salexigens TaxID=1925763 RepID=UPI000C2856FB|nr:EAL domain-containing protein [Marinobacter salexigens]
MPNSTPPFRWPHVLMSVSVGLSLLSLYVLVIAVLAVQGLLASQSTKLDVLMAETETMAAEARTVINRLNSMEFKQCSDEALATMRRELFMANRIRDIGFVQGNTLVCTTGQGVLDSPLEQDPWDYTNKEGFRYWPAARIVLFDGNITAPIAGKGSFNVVLETQWLEQQPRPGGRWELVYRNSPSAAKFTFGDMDVFRNLFETSGQVVSFASTYTETCSATIPYCASMETKHADALRRNQAFSAFLLLIGLVLGAGSGVATWLLLKNRRGIGHRAVRGIRNDSYFPLYQPIVNLETREIIGCEVLARFEDRYGAMLPDEFIPVLAQSQYSWPFTQLIMQKTLADLNSTTGLPDGFKVNINLFPSDIAQSRMKDADIPLALAASRFNIAFEITEDEHLDTATAKDCIQWIKQNGFELAVDDFGTGYSNLSKVRDLGCNTLKIDRSFVFDIDSGGLGAALVPLMVRIAKELDMDVIAEGVETSTQAMVIAGMGVGLAQGWAFGKPMSASQLEKLVCKTL